MPQKEKELKDKCIFRLYRRYKEIEKELKKQYPVHFFPCPIGYSFKAPIDNLSQFLQLRDEAMRIERIIYNNEYKRYVKYVKGGNTFFYAPMKKKEKRKSQRKFRHLPIAYFQQLYKDDMHYQKIEE